MNTRIPKQPGSQYTDQQRKAVIASYVEMGNVSKVAEIHSLPRTTVTGWVRSEWGKELIVKIRHSDEQVSVTNLTKPNGNTLGIDRLVETGSKYTDEQRRKAIALYVSKGLMSAVSRDTGIPESTLCEWKNKSGSWDTALEEVRNEIGDRILAQNLQIAEKSNERVTDSLENGDEKLVWDPVKKEHVIKRVKPTGKEASVMGGIAQDKARTQMGQPTTINSNKSVEEMINELAKIFNDKSNQHKADQLKEKQVNAIPGEYKEIEKDQEK